MPGVPRRPYRASCTTYRTAMPLPAKARTCRVLGLAKVVEIREGRQLDEARVKSWTGGDTMTVRPLYVNPFSFRPTHKLWLAFNHKPVISDDSPAMRRRMRLISLLQRFEGAQNDPNPLETLKAEAPGIDAQHFIEMHHGSHLKNKQSGFSTTCPTESVNQ